MEPTQNNKTGNKLIAATLVVNIITLGIMALFLVLSWDNITEKSDDKNTDSASSNKTNSSTPSTNTPANNSQSQDTINQNKPQPGASTSNTCMKDCVEVQKKTVTECQKTCGTETNTTTPSTTSIKCGDGTCDAIEKADSSLCPKDCSQ